ncbi:aminotransferase class IV [Spirosoma telluris]|uniref:aminotransferase class IV n=1 Tax=Spirosoma telluris TaxID=2183553 RepID=UPI002FC2B01A
MFLVYNSDILSENEFCLSANDRAFQYGDGLFETIRYENGQVWYWPDHFARLTAGMAALQINQPDGFNAETVYQRIQHLLSANTLTNQTARIKIQVWRQSGGLYTPSTNKAHVLISARAGQGFSLTEKSRTGIYDAFRLMQSPISAFKTLNALPYVMAGLYKQQYAFDDVILLDTTGNLAECLASNLFWYGNQTLFTPSLRTGCIGGIVRQQLLRLAPLSACLSPKEFSNQPY